VSTGKKLGLQLATGDLSVAPQVLDLLENQTATAREQTTELLKELSPGNLGCEAKGQIVGITGPPGAGKSSLLSELIQLWRDSGRSVAMLAVDPSSKHSGGSILGDRARIQYDSVDTAVFIRSMAAGRRLGGLAPATRSAAHALAVAFDIVVVETVGVGQSETDISDVADSVAVVVQPGSGDTLQFLKSGIMEIPDVLVVTKVDLGTVAMRVLRDLHAAARSLAMTKTAVIGTSTKHPSQGVSELVEAFDSHFKRIDLTSRRSQSRRQSALSEFITEYGEHGLRALGGAAQCKQVLSDQESTLDAASLFEVLVSKLPYLKG